MTDQELIQALREHAEWARANEWECPITLGDDIYTAIQRLEQMPQWIPVTERLPQKGVDVLVTYPDRHINMGTAGYDDWIDEDFEDGLVTHWMPLPPAPGEEPHESKSAWRKYE